ncbi:MAG: PKD domain-containing protein [Methanoregula sp.]|jgi:PKD repeat protein|nr:PKD domain-containing protein [Methanoregula sp.]
MKKKRVAILLLFVIFVIVLAVAVILHIFPGPGTLAHLFEPKITAMPGASIGSGSSPLALLMNKPLIADFSSAPEGLYSHLTLSFLDQSRGAPESWDWDFGDNTCSDLQHPVHQYAMSGIYNVTLTVIRADGAKRSITHNDVLGAGRSPPIKVLADTLREAYLRKGSEVTFISADANSSVIIDGSSYGLPKGSIVKMRVNEEASGRATIRMGRLVSFAFPDITLFVNGTQVARGSAGDCILPAYQYFWANLSYIVRPTGGEVRQILLDGKKIRAGLDNSRIRISYQSGANGEDLTLVTYPAYFEGAAASFELSDAVIAGFEPGPEISGDAPLNVTFRDISAGYPDTWHWDFGDKTQSDEPNPSHIYSVPGAYSVTLTVSRDDQEDTIVRKKAVIVNPPRVTADFSATPLKGPAPLTIRFTDQSDNAPTSWIWTFGPNSTPRNSTIKDPVVTYLDPGTYTVFLTSGNIYGSSDITRPQFITVTDPFHTPDKVLVVKTGKRGYVEKDSVIEFTVLEHPASISVNGGNRELAEGSVVRLVAMSDQEGEIYISEGEILKFGFPDMALSIDGELVSEGTIHSIYVPAYGDFKTSLSYYLVPNSAYTYVSVSGFEVLADFDNAWIRISNLGVNSDGNLRLISTANSTYIDGATYQTVHDWVIE